MNLSKVGETILWGPEGEINENSELTLIYGADDYEHNSPDCDDWRYTYSFDRANTAAFLKLLSEKGDVKTALNSIGKMFQWKKEMEDFCIANGIHGTKTEHRIHKGITSTGGF